VARIACDVDDTLYSFRETARDELVRRAQDSRHVKSRQVYERAAYATWNDWRTPADLLGGFRWGDVIDACHTDEVILSRTPYVGAVEVIWELVKAGHEITYMTSRKPPTAKATAEWLGKNGFPFAGWNDGGAQLILSGSDKLPLLERHDVLIDDRPRTVIRFVFTPAATARFAFVKMGEWNFNLTDVPGVYVAPTWLGIREGLRRKGFLS
jgi:hypothetical protein